MRLLAALDPDQPGQVVDLPDVHAALGRGIDCRPRTDLVLLGLEAEWIQPRLLLLAERDSLCEPQSPDRLAVLATELVRRLREAFEVGPPLGLRFTMVVLENVGE